MADVKRTVAIDIQVTNNINESLSSILSSLKGFAKDVSKIQETVRSFADSFKEIKISKTVRDTITSITELGKVQPPDLRQFTVGLTRLAQASERIKSPDAFSAIGHLATALKSLEGIKIPDISRLFKGMTGIENFKGINQLKFNFAELAKAIKPLQENTALPGLLTLSKGLRELITVTSRLENLDKLHNTLIRVKNSITPLQGLSFPSVTSFVKGLSELSNIKDIGNTASTLKSLAEAMNVFKGVQFPGVNAFLKGLENLVKLDVAPVTKKIKELAGAITILEKSGHLKAFATFAKDLNSIGTQLGNAIPGLIQVQKAIKGVGEAARTAEGHTKGFGERLTNYLQYRIIADTIFKLQEAFFGTVKAVREFDQALYDLKAITGATDAETAKMGETIIDIASRSKFSATEVAEGMKILGQAGFSATEAIQAMGPITNLAMGTLESLGSTVDVVSTILRVFEMQASQTGHVVDVLANAINKSKLDIDKLRTAFNYVGPTAAEAGISFEETSAAMMVLGNAGLRASTIGTGLRRLFADLVDPSDKFSAAVAAAGYTLDDFNPQIHNLQEIFPKLNSIVSDAGEAFNIFGKLGANAVLTLKESGNGFQEMLGYVNTSGSAAAMAALQTEGLGVMYKNLLDKTQLLGIAIGDAGLTGFLKGLTSATRTAVDAFTLLVNSGIGSFIVKTGLAVVSGMAFLTILGKLKDAYVALKTVMELNIVAGATVLATQTQASSVAISLANGYRFLTTAITTAGTAFKAFFFSSSILSGVFAVAIVPLITWTSMLVKAISSIDDFAEAAQEASKKAIDFSLLQNSMNDYQKNIAGLSKDSEQYKQANLGLQKELYKTANGNLELSESALLAAQSISPLTGEIIDSGEALKAYAKNLDEVTLDKFVSAYKNAVKNVGSQTEGLARNWEGLKNNISNQGTYFSASFAALFKKGALSDNLAKAGKEIESIEFGTMVAENMRKGLDEGKVSWQQFSDYIKDIMQKGMIDQIPAQKDLLEIFTLLDEKARELFNHLMQNGKVDASMTKGEFQAILESMKLSKEEAIALTEKFDKFKESAAKAGDMSIGGQLAKEFSDGKKSAADFYAEYEKGGKALTEQEKQNVESIVNTRKQLGDAYADYMKQYNEKLETGKLTEKDVRKRLVWEGIFEEAVKNSNKAGFLDFQYHSLNKIKVLKEEYDESLRILEASKVKGLELEKRQFQLFMDYQKKVEAATKNSYTTKETTERYQTARKQAQLLQEQQLHDVALAEANGTMLHNEAERKRYEISHNGSSRLIQLAQEEVAAIAAIKDAKPEDKTNAEQRLLEAEKAKTEYIRKELVERSKEETKATEDITKLWEKNKDEFFKFNEAKDKSQRDLDNKIYTAERELGEKLQSLEEKRVTDVKKVEEDILKIRQEAAQKAAEATADGEEKLRLIRQRKMSSKQKETDDKQTAWKTYNEANMLMEKAIKEKDQAMMESAINKYGKSSDAGSNLKSDSAAADLVRANMAKMADAQKALGKLKEEEKQKDIQRINEESQINKDNATRDSNEKIQAARRTFDEQVKLENDRHTIEMKNIGLEMAELQKKLQIAKEIIAAIKEYQGTLKDVEDKGYGKVSTTDGKTVVEKSKQTTGKEVEQQDIKAKLKLDTDEAYKNLNSIGNKAAEVGSKLGESIKEGVKSSSDNVAAQTSEAVEIAKNGYRIIYENGKMIATNLSDTQRTGIEEMTNAALAAARNSFRAITEDSRTAWEKAKEDYINPIQAKVEVNDESVKNTGTLLDEMQQENITPKLEIDKSPIDEINNLLDDINAKIDDIEKQKVTITSDIDDYKGIAETAEALATIKENKDTEVKVAVEGTEKVNDLKEALVGVIDKIITVVANVTGIDAVTSLKNAIDSLHDKTVIITQITRNVTEGATQLATGGLTSFNRLQSRYITQGSGTKDDVPALLMKDEFVHKQAAVKKYGVDFMYKLNNLQIPKSITQMFNKGGLVSNFSSGIVQMFNKGGSVLGNARKKIEEFFGVGSVNLNLGSMNINNEIEQTAKDAINPIGADALSKMGSTFKDTVAKFASGGAINTASVLSAKDMSDIQKSYAQQIALASRNGQSKIVKILEKERDQILKLSETLDASIKKLEQEYILKAELQRKIDSGEITELDANYQLQKKADESDYQKQKEEDEQSFAHEDLEFFQSKEDSKSEFESSVFDAKKETIDSIAEHKNQLEEKKKEVEEYEKKKLKQKEQWATFFAYPKGSSQWNNATMEQLAEQNFRYYRAYDGKITHLGNIPRERVQKAMEKYNTEIGDPLKKAKQEYSTLLDESPQEKEKQKITELQKQYEKSIAELTASRAEQMASRQKSVNDRDLSYIQNRMEADYNYALEKKKQEKEAGGTEASARAEYSKKSEAFRNMFLSRINAVKENSLSEIDKVRMSTASSISTASNAVVPNSNVISSATSSIDELLRRFGKNIMRFNSGGFVPFVNGAKSGVDSIIAALTPREYVLNEHAVSRYGKDLFDMFNGLKIPTFNMGGAVSSAANSIVSTENVMHSLDLSINGNSVGSLSGNPMTIENWIVEMNSAMMRS